MRQIISLPPSLVGRIRSDTHIQGLAQAVVECLSNSIDACAANIEIEIDARELSFMVIDDGCGIASSSMAQLGLRFATSKLRSLTELHAGVSTLGFKGEAIASLVETSVVHVVSRASGSFETCIKILRPGAVLKCGISMEPRPRPGTTVSIRNFLFNQPVRQHQVLASG